MQRQLMNMMMIIMMGNPLNATNRLENTTTNSMEDTKQGDDMKTAAKDSSEKEFGEGRWQY